MPVNMEEPIDPHLSEWQQVLSQAQGNILRAYRCEYTALVLISLDGKPGSAARLRRFARERVTSAWEQERRVPAGPEDKGEAPGKGMPAFGNLFLSVWGYLKLGYQWPVVKRTFTDPQGDDAFLNWFLNGMEQTGWALADPPRTDWEEQYSERLDAMLLLTCDDAEVLGRTVADAMEATCGFGRVLGVERGRRLTRDGQAIEPFGFADGISQPRFFQSDRDDDDKDFCFPSIVLRKDELAGDAHAFGSFLVYRKLEQNVKGFLANQALLAVELKLNGDQELAGAMMVGRFRDGTPLETSRSQEGRSAPDNTFNYANDRVGARCPMHAHIRRVNPRNGATRMVRRGVPYGAYDPTKQGMEPPERGCGLLFMSFQNDIQLQFGEIQKDWANRSDRPERGYGQDPVIGQGKAGRGQRWSTDWGKEPATEYQIEAQVTLKGGEYLFAPSLTFFQESEPAPEG